MGVFLPIIGLALGLLLGVIFPVHIPAKYSQYVAIAILAALDSVFGGINAKLSGKYNEKIFISGFFGNAVIAAGLTMIGARLDLNLYLAAVVVFGTRLFQNFAEIRRYLLKLSVKKDKI
jgi:small basic protein